MKEKRLLFAVEEHSQKDKQLMVCLNPENEQQAIILNNETIIKQAMKNNSEKGFELIFNRYYKPLCSHAVRFIYSKEVAEDIVSEIFLNFWKKKLYETVNSSYRAYLYTAVRNSAYNYLKKEFKDLAGNEEITIGQTELSENTDPQTVLLLDELYCKIEKSISLFSPQCRKVFLLSRFEGKKNREIAEEMQIKLKTVEAHMMKALATLKIALIDYL
ncbi:MAG: RNA polymerase sigma-70 factor [Segetibacter sp.]